MKAGILFTGSGPVLVLTSYEALTDPDLVAKLETKGINKFIAYEIPVEMAKNRYGIHYQVVMGDLHEDDDLRVLDYDGHHIFHTFSLSELGEPIYYEPEEQIVS